MKIDWKKQDSLYQATEKPCVVSVPEMIYLSVSGVGLPSDEAYQNAIRVLYSTAYTIKMKGKGLAGYREFVVPPMETIWWGGPTWDQLDESSWNWECLIRVPEFVTVTGICYLKDNLTTDAYSTIILRRIRSHKAVQALHVGSYSDNSTRLRVFGFIRDSGTLDYLNPDDIKIHEVYLSDPRRVEESRLKTIIRVPVEDS